MPYLTDLATACRTSGLRVVETPGWKTRGHGPMTAVQGIVNHHTGTPAAAEGNYPSLRVVRDGRPDLAGPLCNIGMGRDATVYVVAAGRAYHAGPTYKTWQNNSHAIGIEIEGDGKHPFTDAQLAAIPALNAALAKHYGFDADHVASHKEVAYKHYRKTDPYGVDMDALRSGIAALLRSDDIGSVVKMPPRDPRYGHRGVPKPLTEDGTYGPRTHDAFMWLVHGDRLVGFTRDNVRDVQTWIGGRLRTGKFSTADVRALQLKVSAHVDGDWPIRMKGSNTTVGIQRFINRRIAQQGAA